MRYLKFEDADELIGHLHLLDHEAVCVATRTMDGENIILFNDSEQLETLLHEVTEAAHKLPIDAEVVVSNNEATNLPEVLNGTKAH